MSIKQEIIEIQRHADIIREITAGIISKLSQAEETFKQVAVEVECGQVWEITADENHNYNVGKKGELFIVLSRWQESWRIGCFWSFGKEEIGGARERDLSATEIKEIGRYIGRVDELLKIKKT